MAPFSHLIRFACPAGEIYFADLGLASMELPSPSSQIIAYRCLDDLFANRNDAPVTVNKLLAPIPQSGVPIYCVGLNYKTHAQEAKLSIPANPPLWMKPAAALASPGEDILLTKFCSNAFPDYEGELVFVTSRECRDASPEAAESYILGYTAGNDLSCRMYQMPEQAGGQFFFAKAFDKFAPLGPTLVSPEVFRNGEGLRLITRVNNEVMQESDFMSDLIWSPATILSHMSQGTTIPAGTAVMAGTPSGVGAFKSPRQFLKHDDVVEVEISKIGVLKNRIIFQ